MEKTQNKKSGIPRLLELAGENYRLELTGQSIQLELKGGGK